MIFYKYKKKINKHDIKTAKLVFYFKTSLINSPKNDFLTKNIPTTKHAGTVK